MTGPRLATVTQPYDRIPMWHKRGSLTVTTSAPGVRVARQDWGELTLEIFPGATTSGGRWPRAAIQKRLHERDSADAPTTLEMVTDGDELTIHVSAGPQQLARGWCVRVHLRPGQLITAAEVDGRLVTLGDRVAASEVARPRMNVLRHIGTVSAGAEYFPFAGAGTAAPSGGGLVAELTIERLATARVVKLWLGRGSGSDPRTE